MTLTETLQIATFAIAAISSAIAILAFRRNKNIELQNQLYKIKLEAFSNIVFEIDKYFTIITKSLHEVIKVGESINMEAAKEKLYSIADEVDNQLFACNSLIVKNSVYFSAGSTEVLEQFSNNLLGNGQTFSSLSFKDFFTLFEEHYDKQLKSSNTAVEKIREELVLEKLNTALYKRMS